MHNTMLRCIEIQSDKADVNIRESTFVGHNLTKEGAALRLDVKLNASLKVLNTNFTNNMASEGGAVFAKSQWNLKSQLQQLQFHRVQRK